MEFVILASIGVLALRKLHPTPASGVSSCGECNDCGSQCRGFEDDKFRANGGIHPVNSPHYNMRCSAIQLVLLEDHLNDPMKRCHDCIQKHFLCTEGLLNEAISLDKTKSLGGLPESSAAQVRNAAHRWSNAAPDEWRSIAQSLRIIRKKLQKVSFNAAWAK